LEVASLAAAYGNIAGESAFVCAVTIRAGRRSLLAGGRIEPEGGIDAVECSGADNLAEVIDG
jgi:hypothetical protein